MILGLVLAGGSSRRMGCDKAALDYAGRPQVLRAYELLCRHCARVYVALRPEQADMPLYANLPLLVDEAGLKGPAAGLASAWRRHPGAALLVLAVDMPLVDDEVIRQLLDGRDPTAVATAFRHPDGTPEPLCAVWEPASYARLLELVRAGSVSLRRFLERDEARLIEPQEPEQLVNVNSMEEYRTMRARMA